MTDAGVKCWEGLDVLVVSPTPTHPQDHGNRKRIFEVCAELKRQGAKIHFVHYASEHDWRTDRPRSHEKAMEACWDSYQLVAPSRSLHEPATGTDHEIDEWADPALSSYLRWACSVRDYDVAIVEYTWMSFCFEAIPTGVFRICDTHDVFSGRRDMLEAAGIAPEFFHTTPQEEARALGRADLVWAIKESERVYFERELGCADALTLLHSEPLSGAWKGRPSDDGWLRVGILGARNNINRRNIEEFLRVALPTIENHIAPVKIVIAGGCSADFETYQHPNLEVLGRLPDVADFYRAVDVVCAPMEFSTGLKIKVAEALASGAPLVSHEHAMEGYTTDEPLHLLRSFRSIALELVKLSFDPSPLAALAAKSLAVTARVRADVLSTLHETRERIRAAGSQVLCIVAPTAAMDPASLLFDHLHAIVDYARFARPIVLYLVGDEPCADPDVLRRRGFRVRTYVDPSSASSLSDAARERCHAIEFETFVQGRAIEQVYFMTGVPRLRFMSLPSLNQAYVRCDAVELAIGSANELVEVLAGVCPVAAISSSLSNLRHLSPAVLARIQIPFRRTQTFESRRFKTGESRPTVGALVVGTAGDVCTELVLDVIERCGVRAELVDPDDASTVSGFVRPRGGATRTVAPVPSMRVVIDLLPDRALASALSEGARRAGVPVIRRSEVINVGPAADSASGPHATTGRLARAVALALHDGPFRRTLLEEGSRALISLSYNDSGWAWLWSRLRPESRRAAEGSGAAVGLFGF